MNKEDFIRTIKAIFWQWHGQLDIVTLFETKIEQYQKAKLISMEDAIIWHLTREEIDFIKKETR